MAAAPTVDRGQDLAAEHHRQLLAAALDGDAPQAVLPTGGAIEVARPGDALVVDAEDTVAALEAKTLRHRAVGHVDDHDAAGGGVEPQLLSQGPRRIGDFRGDAGGDAAGAVSSAMASRVSLPPRRTPTCAVRPSGLVMKRYSKALGSSTAWPSTETITSPVLRPARAAGPPELMLATSAPDGRLSPKFSAISGVMACSLAPSHGRLTALPPPRADATTTCTMLEGIANPMPMEPPEREKIAVLMPTSRPLTSTSAPPELPGLIAASVWMKNW